MNEDKAAVALRFNLRATIDPTGSGESLRNIITDKYPDGAFCFVLENRSIYNLEKSSTATPDNVTIVQPNAGPGRWVLLGGGGASGAASPVEIVATAAAAVAPTDVPAFVPVSGSLFDWMPTGAPAGWTLSEPGGILVYGGTALVRARVTLTASVFINTAEAASTIWAAVAHNGDLLAVNPTTNFTPGTQTTETNGTDLPQVISSERTLVLAPGDTLQMMFAGTGTALVLSRGTLAVTLG